MIIDFAAKVDIGRRESNDDRVLVSHTILDQSALSGSVTLPAAVVVCDGCGGYHGGGVAAQTVLETIDTVLPESLADTAVLDDILSRAKEAVFSKKESFPQYQAMCTTVAGCIFSDDRILIFHAGDSRVYRKDRWGLARMTMDHSTVQDLIDMGQITPEEARVHPARNVINRCIGIDCLPPEIYVSNTSVHPGEIFLLCSDGLWDVLEDREIREILSASLPLEQMADLLVEQALKNGSDDNISVCLCAARGETAEAENKPFLLD
ncbi:MAG: serine/threonine-protein phosphatase [Clostridia bacterium]|nr:serine/threonine-protein phosphatase [Clostridia bacterium]